MIRIPSALVRVFSKMLFRYSWWVIALYLVLATAGGYYTQQNLGINSNTSQMFDDELPFRITRDHIRSSFPIIEDNMVVVVSGQTPELVSNVSDSITWRLKQHLEVFESIYQPTRDEFIKKNQLLFLDSTGLQDLSAQVGKSRPMLTFLGNNYSLKGLFSFLGLTMRFSSADKLQNLEPLLISMDSVLIATLKGEQASMSWQNLMGQQSTANIHYGFIQIKPILDYTKIRPVKPAMGVIRNIIQEYIQPGVNIRVTGKKAMSYEEMGSVIDGAVQASILALAMVSIVLWLGLRSFRLIAAALLTLLVGLVLTATFSAWAVGHLNMISVAFAVLYIGLGVDYAIHVCLRFKELRQSDFSTLDSLTISIKDVGSALLLSTLSTSIGFYAFIPTDFAGVSELGIIAGTGMFISLIVTLTLLPCLIWKFTNIYKRQLVKDGLGAHFNFHKYRVIIRLATAVFTVVALWMLSKAKFDYDPINLRNPKSESVSTLRELMANRSFTPWTLHVLAGDSTELAEVSSSLKSLPEIDRIIQIYSFIPGQQPHKRKVIDSIRSTLSQVSQFPSVPKHEPLENQLKAIQTFSDLLMSPLYNENQVIKEFGSHLTQLASLDQAELAPTINALEQNLLGALPLAVQDLMIGLNPSVVSYQTLPPQIKKRWQSEDGKLRLQVFPKDHINSNQQMKKFATAVQQVAPNASGDLAVTIASGETVVSAFKQAIFTALVAISFLLLIYLRNLRLTLYVLMPLLLAGAFTGAATVLFEIDFNFANIIALPLLLGLGVDNGVHMVHRARKEQSIESLLQSSTARAILFSSLTTLLSFGNLAFSPHYGTASMGWILTIGVGFVIMTTLIILPAFLPDAKTAIRD